MKVIIVSYKYEKYFINWLISKYTGIFNPNSEPSSHIEIGLPIFGKLTFFSSTNRDGAKGTRWASPQKVLKNPLRWDYYVREYTEEDTLDMVKRADSILDCDYDWLGIAGFVTPFGLFNYKEKWYCSEACWYALKGRWKRRISPRRFIQRIKRLGFKKVSYNLVQPYLKT